MMNYGCKRFLSIELIVSIRLLQHLHSNLDVLFYHSSKLVLWEVLLLSPLIFPMSLLILLTTQALRWPPLCIWHMVIILSLLWLIAIKLIYSFIDLILEICWLSQNHIGRFYWISFILLCLLVTLVPERFVLYCLGIFVGLLYC